VVDSRQEKEVHGGQEQKGAPLREGSAIEEREHARVVGDATADGWIDDAAVALDRGGQAAEVVGQRELDQHAVRNWRAGVG
jgi:hypothetical protein